MNKRFLFVVCLLTVCMAAMAQSERTFNVPSFQRIQFDAVGRVEFTQGPLAPIRVEGMQQELDKLDVRVEGNTLHIGVKRQKGDRDGHSARVTYYISIPTLEALDVKGVCTFNAKKIEHKGDFKLDVDGVVNLQVDELKCKKFAAEINGVVNYGMTVVAQESRFNIDGVTNGNVTVKGDRLQLTIDGVDNVNYKFRGEACHVECGGVCNGTLDVDCKMLRATASGMTRMTITGTADKVDFGSDGVAKYNTKDLNRF